MSWKSPIRICTSCWVTLILAGLTERRIGAENRSVPWIGEVPFVGVLFRYVCEEVNEVEPLFLLTPGSR